MINESLLMSCQLTLLIKLKKVAARKLMITVLSMIKNGLNTTINCTYNASCSAQAGQCRLHGSYELFFTAHMNVLC